jgi:hypothetical protein
MFAHKFALRAVKNVRILSSNRSMSTLFVRRRAAAAQPAVLQFSCFGSVEPFNQDLINWRHQRRQFGSSAPSNSTDNKEQYKSVDDMINDDAEIRLNNLDLANYDDHGPKSLEDKELDEQNDEEEQQEAEDHQEQTWVTKLTPYALQYGPRVVVASGLAYGFTKISLYITTQLMSITLTDAVWFGFGSGFVVAAATAVSAVATWNTFDSVRPEPVYREALNKIRENEEITQILGPIGFQSKFESGFMRSYKLDGGSLGFGPGHRGFAINVGRGPENKLVWRYPRIQMMFQVYGKKHQALVTVEAFNMWRKTKLNLVALDVLDSDQPEHSEPILVHGEPERMYIRDQLTGFIRFKKNYVTDDVEKYPSRNFERS